MQPKVYPLIIIYMYFSFNRFTALFALRLRPHHILLPARRNALRKLTTRIGYQRPFRLFVVGTTDVDRNSAYWSLICRPDGTKQ